MKFPLKDATLVVNGVDLSNRGSSLSLDLPDDELDASTFQGGDFKEHDKGLSDASMVVTFFNDYDAGKTDETLWPLKISNDPFKMYVQPFDGVPSDDNPAYCMNAKLYNYSPINGQIGQMSTSDVTFRNASSAGVVKCVSPAELTAFLAAS